MPIEARRPVFVLVTCEHAGREVPAAYRSCFRGAADVLRSHRGWDIGAVGVARRLASTMNAPLLATTVTRLLVEPNRSLDHPDLFSTYTRDLPESARASIVATYYAPHRDAVERMVRLLVDAGHAVAHVGVHSFTDVWNGRAREVDVGLLFDPSRAFESDLCARWRTALEDAGGAGRVRFNEPYLGIDDGLTTALRARFAPDDYAGIEVELRQGMIGRAPAQRAWGDRLASALASLTPSGPGRDTRPGGSPVPARRPGG